MSAQARDYTSTAHDGDLRIHPLVLGALLRDLNAARAELKATQAFLSNPALTPPQKVVAYNTLALAGAAPGRPATERATDFNETNRGLVAHRSGLSRDQAGTHVKAIAEAGLIRRQVYTTREEDEEGRTVLRKRQRIAPPDGQAWDDTWARPAHIGAIVRTARMDDAKGRAAKQRAEVKALKQILAQCPECGATDVDLRCHAPGCGAITHADAIPAATTAPARGGAGPFPDNANFTLSGNRPSRAGTPDPDPDADNVKFALSGNGASTTLRGGAAPDNGQFALLDDEGYNSGEFTLSGADTGGANSPAPPVGGISPLDAAVAVIAPAVLDFPDHIVMLARRTDDDTKYTTIHDPLTPALVRDHLVGRRTLGAGLCTPDAFRPGVRHARAIAFDSDTDLLPLTRGAARLKRAGLCPLLVRNRAKDASGHLWLFFDAAIDANVALAAVRTIAPELAEVKEMFPNPDVSNGHRIRLPGGYYLPVGAPRVAVDVALGDETGRPAWVSGVTQAGLAIIGSALSRASILQHTFVPPTQRIAIKKAVSAPPVKRRGTVKVSGQGRAFFDRFNAQNPIEGMVTVGRNKKFPAPWRHEEVASVHVYPDGSWHDFGKDKLHGKDAFDLWCALNGYWDAVANKPDRKAAYRFLNPLPQKESATKQSGDATATDAQDATPGADDPFASIWDGGEE